jgi:HSP20 family protein
MEYGVSFRGLRPEIAGEMEPMTDLISTDKEVKVTVEMPGISKEKIRIDAYDNTVEVRTEDPQRKYHKIIDLPEGVDIETAKSKYNNGILEITFERKKETKPKGKEIKIE